MWPRLLRNSSQPDARIPRCSSGPRSTSTSLQLIISAPGIKEGIEIFKLNLLAYPDSADAHHNLADAYFTDGQKNLARQYAEKGLALLDSHAAPLSSWSDTEQRRAEIRQGLQDLLKKLRATP